MKIFYDFIFNGNSREEIISFGYCIVTDDLKKKLSSGNVMIRPKAAISKPVQQTYSISNKHFKAYPEFDEALEEFVAVVTQLPSYDKNKIEHIGWGTKGFETMKENAVLHGCEESVFNFFKKIKDVRPMLTASISAEEQFMPIYPLLTLDEFIEISKTNTVAPNPTNINREAQVHQLVEICKDLNHYTYDLSLFKLVCEKIKQDPYRLNEVDNTYFDQENYLLNDCYIDTSVNFNLRLFLSNLEGDLGKMIEQRFSFAGYDLKNYNGKPIYLKIMRLKKPDGQYPDFKLIFFVDGKEFPTIKVHTDNLNKNMIRSLIRKCAATGRLIPYKKNR